jgi:hypothetical protein
MRIAIVQSSYIPWKGYFDLIRAVDEFVLFDDVQFTRRDWRNRNRIKTPRGPQWLTIPVHSKGQYREPIKDITISDPDWAHRHWRTLKANYMRAPCFSQFADRIERLYADCTDALLSAINYKWIVAVCDILGIRTKLTWSMDYELAAGATERLVGICRQAGADTYVSGPSARAYIDQAAFDSARIKLVYFDYAGYPEYPQLYPPFDHHVTVLDLLFHQGRDAARYLLGR